MLTKNEKLLEVEVIQTYNDDEVTESYFKRFLNKDSFEIHYISATWYVETILQAYTILYTTLYLEYSTVM